MRLTRLEVTSLPGLPDGFTLEPGAGVNLLVGPNASGKSSVARAVRSLLWPDAVPDAARHRLAAHMDLDGVPLTVARSYDGAVAWTSGGARVAPAPVPADHLRDRYELGLFALTAGPRGADGFAAEVRLQMAGGFDLDIAGITLFPRTQAATTRRLNEFQKRQLECDALERAFNSLRANERDLESLRAELAAVKSLADEAPALAVALQVFEARAAVKAADEALAAFPAALAAYGADDRRLLAEGLERLRAATDEAATATARLATAEAELAGLKADAPGDADPLALQACVEALKTAEAARDQAAAKAAGVRAARDAALAALGGTVAAGGAAPGREAVERLGRLFIEAEGARARLRAAETMLDATTAGGAAPGADVDGALAALEAWLAAPVPGAGWPLAAAGLGAATTLALALTGGGALPVVPLALAALVAVGGIALAARAFGARGAARRLGDRARATLAAAGVAEAVPDRAAATRVRDRMLKDAARRDGDGGTRARLEADRRRADEDLRAALAEAASLCAACGLGAGLDSLGVMRDVANLEALHRAGQDLAEAEAGLGERESRLAAKLAEAGAMFARAGLPAPTGAEFAAAAVQQRREELGRARSLAETADTQRALLAAAQRRHAEAAASLARLRGRLSLAPDGSDDYQVAQLADRHADWLAASRSRAEAATTLRLREEAVLPAHRALPEAELAARRNSADAARDEAEALHGRIAAIEAAVAAARRARAWEQAVAELDRERDRLVEDRAQARRAALADALLADLRARNAATRRPVVLDRAASLLKDFTRGRGALDIDGGADAEASFAVRDAHTGARQSPAELSDGTRAQLLLAVRLAFIETMERDTALPLFLDEALTTTDDERFAAVAEALGRVARDQGRQVFYLTSQPRDVDAWRAALAAAGLPEPRVLDLAAARRLARAATPAQLPPPPPPAVPRPAPGAAGLAAWRLAVGVPPFDPRREPAAQHVDWLLLDDADLLYRLVVARADLVGAAVGARDHLVAAGVVDAAAATALAERATLLEIFCAQWRVGRGRALTIEDIEASGAVSNVMRERVQGVFAQSGGDAEAFLAGLDGVKGLRESTVTKVREHLAEAGVTDERDVFDEPELLRRVLAQAGLAAARGAAPAPDASLVASCVARWWRAAQAALAR